VSFSTSPSGVCGGTKSSTSISTSSPILTRWRRPFSAYSMGGGLDPQHLADQRREHGHRPAELAGEDRPELLRLLLGRGGVQEDPNPPVAIGHQRGVSARTATVRSLTSTSSTVPESTWKTNTTWQRS
jgi:hypothetical protein